MADKPVISIPETDPPTELVTEDLAVGEGVEATVGKRVIVHYVGVSWSTGDEFDASWDRGSTFDFRLGAREVIEGWEKGVKGMTLPLVASELLWTLDAMKLQNFQLWKHG